MFVGLGNIFFGAVRLLNVGLLHGLGYNTLRVKKDKSNWFTVTTYSNV